MTYLLYSCCCCCSTWRKENWDFFNVPLSTFHGKVVLTACYFHLNHLQVSSWVTATSPPLPPPPPPHLCPHVSSPLLPPHSTPTPVTSPSLFYLLGCQYHRDSDFFLSPRRLLSSSGTFLSAEARSAFNLGPPPVQSVNYFCRFTLTKPSAMPTFPRLMRG